MKKTGKKVGKIIKKVLLGLLLLLVLCLAGTTIWNQSVSRNEKKQLEKMGQIVEVDGKEIHVSVCGNGEKTIVLLSGLGTPGPINDFAPLSKKLGETYQVVTLEYAGYGLSGDTKEERTNEDFAKEIHDALQALQIKPPYILMPHSISGLYCMQYMKQYKGEVEAMIGIDSSVPNQAKYEEEEKLSGALYYLARFMDITGLTRLTYQGEVPYLSDMAAGGCYTEQELSNAKALVCQHSVSRSMFNEMNHIKQNCEALYDETYPEDVPVLFLLSKDSNTVYEKAAKENAQRKNWQQLHEEAISNLEIQKIEYLDGSHYLYWTQLDKIVELADSFIQEHQE